MTLRLVSYNVHKCLGLDRRRRPDRIIAVIAALKPDILALQEVDHRLGPRIAALPRALLEHGTGLAALPFALAPRSLGWHGQVLLLGHRLIPRDILRIALPGLEPRGAIAADLDTPEGSLRVVGVHLGLLRRHRQMQLAAIRAALSHRAPLPTVILGDFNDWSARGAADALGPGFRSHTPGPSFPAARPVARLDRLVLGRGVHLIDAGTGLGDLARIASDHLPVWADVRLSPDG